jgi:hypothetical protein
MFPYSRNLHGNIAGDVWPKGATLTCATCGHAEHATSEDCGRYLARGWPKHCGQTMTVTAAQ